LFSFGVAKITHKKKERIQKEEKGNGEERIGENIVGEGDEEER